MRLQHLSPHPLIGSAARWNLQFEFATPLVSSNPAPHPPSLWLSTLSSAVRDNVCAQLIDGKCEAMHSMQREQGKRVVPAALNDCVYAQRYMVYKIMNPGAAGCGIRSLMVQMAAITFLPTVPPMLNATSAHPHLISNCAPGVQPT